MYSSKSNIGYTTDYLPFIYNMIILSLKAIHQRLYKHIAGSINNSQL